MVKAEELKTKLLTLVRTLTEIAVSMSEANPNEILTTLNLISIPSIILTQHLR